MADSAKDRILGRITEQGHTDSYGTLLYLAAVMGIDPIALDPDNPVELNTWSGHLDGLRASLLWLAIYERGITPEEAADVVNQHLLAAISDLGSSGNAGSPE